MAELITLGEPLAVFASKDLNDSLVDAENFNKTMGGAELNVMIGASRLGHSTEYITQLGSDPFGEYIKKTIDLHDVGCNYIKLDSKYTTGFYLKEFVNQGDPKTYYFRKGSAAANIKLKQIDEVDFKNVKWAHLSGIFPAISKEAQETFEYFIEKLTAEGIHTTFDPNLRPALWESEKIMRKTINNFAKAGEVVLPGVSEGLILTGSDDPEKIADFYLDQSQITQTVIVKLGEKGAFVKTKSGDKFKIPGFKVENIIDTVGAGDGFAVGILTAFLEKKTLKEAVTRACAIGALAVTSTGDNAGYPTRMELENFYKEKGII